MAARMRFRPDDEKAFYTRRGELGEQFARWLSTHDVTGDPNDAGLLMDWKWGYADGALDRWRVDDVNEFLFEWCPRKLSSTPEDGAEIPASVAAFAREGGIEVVERPDPARADAAAIVDLASAIDEQEWMRDVGGWFAAQPDPAAAATALASAALDARRETLVAMAGLQAPGEHAGEHAAPAVRPHLEGPHDGIVVTWMLERSAVDLETIDPNRLVLGLVDALAAVPDAGGPDEMIAMLDGGSLQERPGLLERSGDWTTRGCPTFSR